MCNTCIQPLVEHKNIKKNIDLNNYKNDFFYIFKKIVLEYLKLLNR